MVYSQAYLTTKAIRKRNMAKYQSKRGLRSTRSIGYVPRLLRAAIPKRMYAKLKYVDTGTFSCASGTLTSLYQYQTSLYDPRASLGGHQPLFFDQYAAMYKSYIVYGIRYKMSFISLFDYGATVYVVYRTDTTLDTNEETIMEKSNRTVTRGLQSTGPLYTTGYVSVASVFGVDRKVISTDDKFKASVGANPTNMVTLTPFVRQYHPSLAKDSVVHIELTYYCEFLDRQDVSAS